MRFFIYLKYNHYINIAKYKWEYKDNINKWECDKCEYAKEHYGQGSLAILFIKNQTNKYRKYIQINKDEDRKIMASYKLDEPPDKNAFIYHFCRPYKGDISKYINEFMPKYYDSYDMINNIKNIPINVIQFDNDTILNLDQIFR